METGFPNFELQDALTNESVQHGRNGPFVYAACAEFSSILVPKAQ